MFKKILVYWLAKVSAKIIKKYRPTTIGITGSVGKTSTKEVVVAMMQKRFALRASYKNYNNEVGIPLAIIGVEKTPGRSFWGWLKVWYRARRLIWFTDRDYPEMLVLEMGADKPGDIRHLTNIAPCSVGVLTAISHAHAEAFQSLKKIAQEKRVILTHLGPENWTVLNYDNELVMEQSPLTKAKIITYGFKEGASWRATDVNIIYDDATARPTGLNFKVNFKGQSVPVFVPGALAEHFIPAVLAGMAVANIFGVNTVEAAEALQQIKLLPGRMRLLEGIKNTLIIDDTYNSSPEAAKSALKTLAAIPIVSGAERYAVLGDMLELGQETDALHREVGFKVAESGIDFLITVGEASKHTALAALEAGLPEHHVASFADSVNAGKFLQEKLAEHDLVLVKGSQGARMEKIVKEVMAEPLRAPELLVRQESEWK